MKSRRIMKWLFKEAKRPELFAVTSIYSVFRYMNVIHQVSLKPWAYKSALFTSIDYPLDLFEYMINGIDSSFGPSRKMCYFGSIAQATSFQRGDE